MGSTVNINNVPEYFPHCIESIHPSEQHLRIQRYSSNQPVFRNGPKMLRKILSRREINIGVYYHFLNTTLETIFRFPVYLGMASGSINPIALGALYLTEIIAYPFNTAFRRLTCQHTTIPGMIPLRYRGLRHALMLIASQQGLLGLYKGFGLHHLTIALRVASIGYLMPMFQRM